MVDEFATLAWNADLGWWSGKGEVASGHPIEFHVQVGNDPSVLQAAQLRNRLSWDHLRAEEGAIRKVVASQMVEAHNEYCNPDDEVTPAQFAARLRLKSVLFESSGTIELCYDDGLLFGGHWIIVPIEADGSVGQATEAG